MLPKRPLALKAAVTMALLGIGLGLIFTILEIESYGDGWVIFVPARIFMAIIWLVVMILALNGRGWVRYLFGGFVLIGLLRVGYFYPDHLLKEGLWLFHLPPVIAMVLFSSPSTNKWYKDVASFYAQQNAQAGAG